MSQKKPEGGQVHKLTVTFRSWIPQEEEAWRHLVAGSVVGLPAAARARGAIIAALVKGEAVTGNVAKYLVMDEADKTFDGRRLADLRAEYSQDEREQLPVDTPTCEDVEDA